MIKSKTQTAFTLAEVLITLAIIGVVAALTLPTLMHNYKKNEASARLRKFNSIFNQMVLLSENDNGPSGDWERNGDITDESGKMDWSANFAEQRRFFDKYFAPYLEYLEIKDGETDTDEEGNVSVKSHVRIYFKDGSSANFYNGGAYSFVYDVNGDRQPNLTGYDRFVWDIWPSTTAKIYYPKNYNYGTRRMYGDAGTKTRTDYLNYCKNDNVVFCTRLLELDNWEFKDDYPYKL